jgi:hypothetical protein
MFLFHFDKTKVKAQPKNSEDRATMTRFPKKKKSRLYPSSLDQDACSHHRVHSSYFAPPSLELYPPSWMKRVAWLPCCMAGTRSSRHFSLPEILTKMSTLFQT